MGPLRMNCLNRLQSFTGFLQDSGPLLGDRELTGTVVQSSGDRRAASKHASSPCPRHHLPACFCLPDDMAMREDALVRAGRNKKDEINR